MQSMLDSFCRAVGIAAALLNSGNLLVVRIGSALHRLSPGNVRTLEKCIDSTRKLATDPDGRVVYV